MHSAQDKTAEMYSKRDSHFFRGIVTFPFFPFSNFLFPPFIAILLSLSSYFFISSYSSPLFSFPLSI